MNGQQGQYPGQFPEQPAQRGHVPHHLGCPQYNHQHQGQQPPQYTPSVSWREMGKSSLQELIRRQPMVGVAIAGVALVVFVGFVILLFKSPFVAGCTVFALLVFALFKIGKSVLNRPRRPVIVQQAYQAEQPLYEGTYGDGYQQPVKRRGFFYGLGRVVSAPFRLMFFVSDVNRETSIRKAERNAGKVSEAMLEMGREARRHNMAADRAQRVWPWK